MKDLDVAISGDGQRVAFSTVGTVPWCLPCATLEDLYDRGRVGPVDYAACAKCEGGADPRG